MDQRTRKARGSSQRSSHPSSSMDYKVPMQGAYSNEVLTAELCNLLGFVIEATTREGVVYEGVFTAVSPEMNVTLDLVHVKTDKLSPGNVKKNLQLNLSDIVTMVAKVTANPSMEQKEGLKLDRDIGSRVGSSATRELQPFTDFEDSKNVAVHLGLDGSGWHPEDMWRENEEKFNVQSTYDERLIQYTIPLEKMDTEEFRKKEARAEKLAFEIESKQDWPILNEHIDSTEEEKFSAVQSDIHTGPQFSNLETQSKPVGCVIQTQSTQHATSTNETTDSVNETILDGASVHVDEEAQTPKSKEEVIRAFQLNPAAKEFTPKEFSPVTELGSPSVTQGTSPSQSPQTFYNSNKGRYANFQKPRPRLFIGSDTTASGTASGYIYQSPSVAVSPPSVVRPFVPAPATVFMPGPYGIVSPHHHQLLPGKMMEFVPPPPPSTITMGQAQAQQHYIGPLGQPSQAFPAPPQLIPGNQQPLFYVQQGTAPSFVPPQPVSHASQMKVSEEALNVVARRNLRW